MSDGKEIALLADAWRIPADQLALKAEQVFLPHIVRRRLETLENRAMRGGEQPHLLLAHYTSADAAVSIITNKRLWMRNTTCMADFSEVRHGFDIINGYFSEEKNWNRLRAALEAYGQGLADEAASIFRSLWNTIQVSTYIASFSEHCLKEDRLGRLSMWRAFAAAPGKVAFIFKVPSVSPGAKKLNLTFNPVAYLSHNEACAVLEEVIQNVTAETTFLKSLDRQLIVNIVVGMFVTFVTCLKHQAFAEEREWRAIYSPDLQPSSLMESQVTVINGVAQPIYKIPLDARVSPELADLDFAARLDHIIIGPTPYPWVMYRAIVKALDEAGIPDATKKVWNADIPLR